MLTGIHKVDTLFDPKLPTNIRNGYNKYNAHQQLQREVQEEQKRKFKVWFSKNTTCKKATDDTALLVEKANEDHQLIVRKLVVLFDFVNWCN